MGSKPKGIWASRDTLNENDVVYLWMRQPKRQKRRHPFFWDSPDNNAGCGELVTCPYRAWLLATGIKIEVGEAIRIRAEELRVTRRLRL